MEKNKEGLSAAIENLVKTAVDEKYPSGEPEPRLFSEGYRQALNDYGKYKVRQALRRAMLK